jgi:hypothetical protein
LLSAAWFGAIALGIGITMHRGEALQLLLKISNRMFSAEIFGSQADHLRIAFGAG